MFASVSAVEGCWIDTIAAHEVHAHARRRAAGRAERHAVRPLHRRRRHHVLPGRAEHAGRCGPCARRATRTSTTATTTTTSRPTRRRHLPAQQLEHGQQRVPRRHRLAVRRRSHRCRRRRDAPAPARPPSPGTRRPTTAASPITGYLVTASPSGATASTGPAARSVVVRGPGRRRRHPFTVQAVNQVGLEPDVGGHAVGHAHARHLDGRRRSRAAYPCGLAAGPSGSVYAADRGAGTVVRVAADGTKTTVAGGGDHADQPAGRAGPRHRAERSTRPTSPSTRRPATCTSPTATRTGSGRISGGLHHLGHHGHRPHARATSRSRPTARST